MLKTSLASLDAEIVERRRYLREQEKLITELVESGNMQLMALNYEITLAKKQLHELKTDIRTMTHDKVLLSVELKNMNDTMMATQPLLVNICT